MPTFSDIRSILGPHSMASRKDMYGLYNSPPDVILLIISFVLYLACYFMGFHILCLGFMGLTNVFTAQIVNRYNNDYMAPSVEDTLSIKQREQGRTENSVNEEQEEKVNSQLQDLVNETQLRNSLRNNKTPSASSLTEDDYVERKFNSPELKPVKNTRDDLPELIYMNSKEIPDFSQGHYLHSAMYHDVD
jgi:hypothetical protein